MTYNNNAFKVCTVYNILVDNQIIIFMIDQKGMTFDHDFCYSFSFSSSLFFYGGREKEKRITKVVVKSHAFLLDQVLLFLKKANY